MTHLPPIHGHDAARPEVSIIVPARNAERTIGDCLSSLLAQDHPLEAVEIVVVDNASADRTAEIVGGFPVRCVSEDRRGPNHARNRGIRASAAPVLAFIDADCVTATAWLGELIAEVSSGAMVVGGEVMPQPSRTAAQRYGAIRKPSIHDWCLLHGFPRMTFSNAALRREVFDRVGLLDGSFSHACEDIDFSRRLTAAGVEMRYRPTALALHRQRSTTGGLFRQQLGYGRGQAELCRKYRGELGWGWPRELGAWGDLAASGLGAVWGCARTLAGETDFARSRYPYLDFVRKLGQRLGFTWGVLAGAGRR